MPITDLKESDELNERKEYQNTSCERVWGIRRLLHGLIICLPVFWLSSPIGDPWLKEKLGRSVVDQSAGTYWLWSGFYYCPLTLLCLYLLGRPGKIVCENCKLFLNTTAPWICGCCKSANRNTRFHSFLDRCKVCRYFASGISCPHCDILNTFEIVVFKKGVSAHFIHVSPIPKLESKKLDARDARKEALEEKDFGLTLKQKEIQEDKLDAEHARVKAERIRANRLLNELLSPKPAVSHLQKEMNAMMDAAEGGKAKLELWIRIKEQWEREIMNKNLLPKEREEALERIGDILESVRMKYL